MSVGIIDTGTCNVRSILKAFEKIDVEVGVLKSAQNFPDYDRFVMPGVGSWDYAVESLQSKDLWDSIIHFSLVEKKPLLGICLGMQLLADSSEEGHLDGLGLIPGKVLKMNPTSQDVFRVPNVGWSYVYPIPDRGCDNYLSRSQPARFYFVHSYHFCCDDDSHIAMQIELEKLYCAVVIRDNIWGAQFHPEKSHNFGLEFLETWVNS